jgi:hypothetical protein
LRDFFDGVFADFRLDESDGVAIGAAFVTTGVGCWAWMDGWHGHVDRYGSRLFYGWSQEACFAAVMISGRLEIYSSKKD